MNYNSDQEADANDIHSPCKNKSIKMTQFLSDFNRDDYNLFATMGPTGGPHFSLTKKVIG